MGNSEADTIEKIKSEIGEVFISQTKSCSNVSRQIAFSMLALTGALSYYNGEIIFSIYTAASFLFLVAFLVLDLLQYFLTAWSYRSYFKRLINSSKTGKQKEAAIITHDVIKRNKINSCSFTFMVLKICTLPIGFILIVISIIERIR